MKKRRKNLLLRLAVFSFVVYIAAMLINQQIQIGHKKAEIATLNTQYQAQLSKNAEMQRELAENNDQYMESVARDTLGYAQPNERIYVNVPGN